MKNEKVTDQDESKNMSICLRVILTNTWSTFFLLILFFPFMSFSLFLNAAEKELLFQI